MSDAFECITDVNVPKNGNHSSYFPVNVDKFSLGKRTRVAASDWSDTVAGDTVPRRENPGGLSNSRIFDDTA